MYFASKGLGYLTALLLLLSLLSCYKLLCYQTTLLLTISALADITLLKTTCHFLLLFIGFDTLTYRKDYDCSPKLVGYQRLQPLTPKVEPAPTECYFWTGGLRERVSAPSPRVARRDAGAQGGIP